MSSTLGAIGGFISGNPLSVAVGGLSALSSLSSSNQGEAQAKQIESTDYANASLAIANMQAVEAQASAQEEAVRQSNDQTLGRQRAAMADSGTGSISSGSNLAVARQSAYSAEIDALNTRYAGQLRGSQYLQSAYNYRAGAEAAAAQAAQLAQTSPLSAGVSALTGFASSYARGIKGTTNLSASSNAVSSGLN